MRILAFTAGIGLGLIGVALAASSDIGTGGSFPDTPLSGTVEVRYVSWEFKEGFPVAKFAVANSLRSSITYGAFAKNNPFPTVRVNGEQLNFMNCGTGQQDFSVASGETAIFEVPAYYFRDRVRPEDSVTVGFWVRPGVFGKAAYFGTDSFAVPAELLAAAGTIR